MTPGKIASQTGHAYLGAAIQADPLLLAEYHKDFPGSPGTKICLQAADLEALLEAQSRSIAAGIPNCLITDSGCPNFYDGQPVITALGLGPARRSAIKHIVKKFKLL